MKKTFLFFLLAILAPLGAIAQIIVGPSSVTVPCMQPCHVVHANYIKPKQTTSYTSASVAYAPVPITSPNTLSLLDDKFSGAIPIGFTFCFYGVAYTQLTASANGHLSFNLGYASGNCSFDTKQPIPFYNATYPDNAIFCPFTDGNTSVGGSITYKTVGNAPYRKFVIQYSNIPFFGTGTTCTGSPSTFQCVLNETFNNIDFFINNKSTCNSDTTNWLNYSTLGIQSTGAGNFHIVNNRNATIWGASNEGWRIDPAGPPAYTLQWHQNGVPLASNVDSVNICDPFPKQIIAELQLICPNISLRDTVDIIKNNPVIDSVNLVNTTCQNTTNGSATIFVSGGTPGYTYSLNSGPWVPSNYFNNLSFGTHSIRVRDANGCESNINVSISTSSNLQAVIDSAKRPSCPTNNGFLHGTAIGGTPPYTYNWFPGNVTTQNNNNLAPGYYVLQVTDSLGCINQVGYLLKWDSLPIITANASKAVCGDSTGAIDVGVQGNGPFSYSWSNNANTQDLTNIPSGTYTILVTDINGCSDSLPISVIDTLNMSLLLTGFAHTSCGYNNGMGASQVSNGLAPYSYLWSNGDTTASTNTLSSGWQYITASDNNGCVRTDSLFLNASVPIQISFLHTNAYCDIDNGVITSQVSGHSGIPTYTWSHGDSTAITDSLAAGTYVLTVTDIAGCTAIDSFTIINEGKPSLLVLNYQKPKCHGDSSGVLLLGGTSGVAPYKYSFDGVNFSTTALITQFAAGSYTIYIRDANSCVSDTTIFFDPPNDILVTQGNVDTLACFWDVTGLINFTANNGTPPYTWSTDSTNFQSQAAFGNFGIGTNTLFVKDSLGCIKKHSFEVPGPPSALQITYESENVPCYYSTGGNIDAQIIGGWIPYSYTWNHSATQNLYLTDMTAGQYVLSVTDAKNCKLDSLILINQNYCCDCYFPNAFTPNGDDNNDAFKAITPATDITSYKLQIYNRWGQRVFSTERVDGAWDGTFQNQEAPTGTYFFQCKLKCKNKENDVYLKGDCILIR